MIFDYHIFGILFQKGRQRPSFYPFLKNAQGWPKSTRQILKVDILGYK